MKAILSEMYAREEPMKVFEAATEFRAQSISDAVALSAAPCPEGMYHLFFAVGKLALQFLAKGIFIRGAITKGRLYHDASMVFGEGLVRAYHTEQIVARYPRIIVTRDVRTDFQEYMKQHLWREKMHNALRQADDGPYYLHFLDEMCQVVEGALSVLRDRDVVIAGHPS
jgi:hypothetical protein